MRAKFTVVVAAAWLLLIAAPVRTHHAFSSEFDIDKPLIMKGTLTKFEVLSTDGAKFGAAGSKERLLKDSTVTGSVTPWPAAGL